MKNRNIRSVLWAITFILIGSIITKLVDFQQNRLLTVQSHSWDKVMLVLDQIEKNYVDQIDYESMNEKAIQLILKELDPHSVYLPPTDLKDADEELDGNFDGIGILFNIPEDTAIIINPIPGGPSERAGLLSGDRILKVDGMKVAGVSINQDTLVSKMRGVSGTKVSIQILREEELVTFDIERAKIPLKSIDVAYMINDTTAYIKLSKFARTSHEEFIVATASMKEKGLKKIIFDLRDNAGGYLDQALLLSNEFLDEGKLIVYMEGIRRPRQDFHADGRGLYTDVEIDVLMNENSASSSEIFAGAIQDNDRGNIYGRRSFGKGLVQEPINFSDQSGLRLTVARFHTPTGRSIQKPYTSDGEEYVYDIVERYTHGEMIEADSIPRNDSLRYITPKGRVVYGGGGIIPDIFVPVDTTGVTEVLIKVNRRSLQVKFAIKMADKYRAKLREVKTLTDLNKLLNSMNLESEFVEYIKANSIAVPKRQWSESRKFLMLQVRAMIGRYSVLDDNAFYPIIAEVDNVVQAAINQ